MNTEAQMRQPGFYWVRVRKGKWVIAEWDSIVREWSCIGLAVLFRDDDFQEIDERRVERVP